MKKILPIIRYAVSVLIALTGFLFIYRYINPELINFKQQPLFLHNDFFFKSFLNYPGGLSEYISRYLSQFYISKFYGTIIIVLLAGSVTFIANRLLKKYFSDLFSWVLALIPGILLVCLHSYYQADLQTDLVMLTGLLSAFLIQKYGSNKLFVKIPLLIAVALGLYFYFSETALLLFSIVFIADGFISKQKNILTYTIILLSAVIVLPYYTSVTSAYQNFSKAFYGIIESKDKQQYYFQLAILCCIPATTILASLANLFNAALTPNIKRTNIIGIAIPLLMLTGTITAFFLSFNPERKNNIMIHYYADNEKWKEVLQTGEKLSLNDRKVMFQINRALYHQGKLVDRSFMIPQVWGEHGLILTTFYNSEVLMYCSDLFYDMGHVKGALHWAYEAQTKFPYAPNVLKRIALCNLLLGEYTTAEKFLTILSQSTIHNQWAKKYTSFLNNDQAINADPVLGGKRKLIPHDDFYSNTQHPLYDLSMLITQHPENKMAFEYFMLDALLTHDLSKVASNLSYLGKLGYKKIPTHIEEGLMLFMTLNKDYKIDFGDYTISNETQEKFAAYSKLLMKYRQNRKEGQAEFRKDFGNTFWYYIQFVSPITTKREFQEK